MTTVPLFSVDNLVFSFSTTGGHLEGVMCLTVCCVLAALHASRTPAKQSAKTTLNAEFWLLNLFAAFMCLAIAAGNLFLFFVGFEAMSIISATLVGAEAGGANHAARVFLFGKFASLLFLVAACLTVSAAGSLEFQEISKACLARPADFAAPAMLFGISALCKSAQIPFSNWLATATKANPFVSVFIHSATVIGVGVVFFVKCRFLLETSSSLHSLLVSIGLLSALCLACRALTVNLARDAKKAIAYLTASSAGLMYAALGLGKPDVAAIYFICHAFFKSALFLGLMCATDASASANSRGISVWISLLASAGIPLLCGSFAKASLAEVVRSSDSWLIAAAIMVTSLATNIAMLKMAFCALFSKKLAAQLTHPELFARRGVRAVLALNAIGIALALPFVSINAEYIKDCFTNTALCAIAAVFANNKRLAFTRALRRLCPPARTLDMFAESAQNIASLINIFQTRSSACVADFLLNSSKRLAVIVDAAHKNTIRAHAIWIAAGLILLLSFIAMLGT